MFFFLVLNSCRVSITKSLCQRKDQCQCVKCKRILFQHCNKIYGNSNCNLDIPTRSFAPVQWFISTFKMQYLPTYCANFESVDTNVTSLYCFCSRYWLPLLPTTPPTSFRRIMNCFVPLDRNLHNVQRLLFPYRFWMHYSFVSQHRCLMSFSRCTTLYDLYVHRGHY
jgi:hypothetical protein